MQRSAWFSLVLLATASGLGAPGSARALDDAALLAGHGLELGDAAVPAADGILALDADMRAFVAPLTAVRTPEARLAALLEAMEDRGLFSLDYAETTRTASATFHERQGNCLSFTLLFVALARAAGLSAAYQIVEVPPTWANDGQVVVARHVNSIVRTVFGSAVVVDFNIRDYEGTYPARRVGDAYVLGLFYVNQGAEALLRGEHAASFRLLREAVRVAPDLAGAWVNLGVLYAREQRYDYAEAAYLRALEVDSDEPSALANLALVYAANGDVERAELYRERVQRYREQNPYYHFAVAERAQREARFDDTLAALRKALKLKHDESEFHELRGAALAALGRVREAEQSYARASAYAAEEQARRESLVRLDTVALR